MRKIEYTAKMEGAITKNIDKTSNRTEPSLNNKATLAVILLKKVFPRGYLTAIH